MILWSDMFQEIYPKIHLKIYLKNPKNSDAENIVVIILKFE